MSIKGGQLKQGWYWGGYDENGVWQPVIKEDSIKAGSIKVVIDKDKVKDDNKDSK